MNPSSSPQDILVIDDNPGNLGVLSELLQESGYHVRVATNGRRGLAAARQARPDLVMLDITMPEMDGFAVCESLKQDPALAEVPVIFLSAHEEALDKVRAFQVGGADYVQKPFQVQEVLMRARYQLRLASLQKELQIQNQSLETANVHIQEALQESKGLNRELLDINERLRRSEATQGDFLAKMRHEINTPLSALLGLATQLLQDQLPPEQLASLGRMIQAEAFHLDFQVRNVFAAADLEAGAVTPVITQVDVDSVLLNVIDAFSRRASAKSMEVLLEARPEPGPLLFGTDAGMLRLIAANLLANAIEFGPEGTQVSLRAALEGEVLRLDIQDQGMGIRKEHQALIFDRFRQVEEGSTRTHPGQGLGLPVTRALVDLLEGSIEVISAPGEGARFTCRLPRRMPLEDASTAAFEGNMFIFDNPEER